MPDLLISSQYCAGVPTGTIAPGDSGGPSILRTWNDGEQFTLVGVVSGRHRVGDAFYTFIQHEQVLECFIYWVLALMSISDPDMDKD